MENYDVIYRKAAAFYYQLGAATPLEEMPLDRLDAAQSLASTIPYGNAQELCAWANVEMMFPAHTGVNAVSHDEVYERATAAFGRAYDLYNDDGEDLHLRRLELAHAALPFYRSYAKDEIVTHEQKKTAAVHVAEVGRRLIKMSEEDDMFLDDGRVVAACAETITILGLSLKAGDARKPADTIAIPSTLRQRLANSSRSDKQLHGREKWEVTQLGRAGDGWRVRSRIAFDTKVSRGEKSRPADNITQISDKVHLTNGINDMVFTLRALVGVYEGRAGKSEESFAKDMSRRIIRITSRR